MKMEKKGKETKKQLMQTLRDAESSLYALAGRAGELRDAYELPQIVEEIVALKKKGKVKNITSAWAQRKFKLGYLRTAKLMDALKAKKIIK